VGPRSVILVACNLNKASIDSPQIVGAFSVPVLRDQLLASNASAAQSEGRLHVGSDRLECFLPEIGDRDLPQSIDIPLARIGRAHFSISLGMNLVRYSGVRRSGGTTFVPKLLKRSRTAGAGLRSCGLPQFARLRRLDRSGERYNHRYGTCWIGLRPCDARDGRQRNSARGQMQKPTTLEFH
jgi:hypothetical protein